LADTRFHTDIDWLDSWHSFSFGGHYDPDNTNHGLLLVLNDDLIAGGGAFGTHPHRDMEIVTWVLDGTLEHRDSEGNHGIITRNVAQRMSAGTGIRHSEANASERDALHLLQMWVPPDTKGIAPGYEQVDATGAIKDDELFPLASGREADAAVKIHQRDATLWIGRVSPEGSVTVPAAPFVHVFVALGSADFDGVDLEAGDAVRLTDAGEKIFNAGIAGAELVIWETHATI
jgi:redox-sensitive bicupin YhaK (pirin superfamily)